MMMKHSRPKRELIGINFDAPLGSGGFGSVYEGIMKCESTMQQVVVAVKMLDAMDEQAVQRFAREQIVMRMLHERMPAEAIPVLLSGKHKGHPYYVMPFYSKGSLDGFLKGRKFTPAAGLQVISAIASVLSVAHELGIVHNDLKTANIFIDSEGKVFIGDWGIAYAPDDQELTKNGSQLGTEGWTDPLALNNVADARRQPMSDIFSLGRILSHIAQRHKVVDIIEARLLRREIDSCAQVIELAQIGIQILEEEETTRRETLLRAAYERQLQERHLEQEEIQRRMQEARSAGIGAFLLGGLAILGMALLKK
jgi:serine/threonine protein kinase